MNQGHVGKVVTRVGPMVDHVVSPESANRGVSKNRSHCLICGFVNTVMTRNTSYKYL